jgi:hypothetical protein
MQQLADLRARTASAAPRAAEATAPAGRPPPAVESLDSPSPPTPPTVAPAGRYEDEESLDIWSPPALPEAFVSTLPRESDPDERALQLLLTLPPALQRSDAVAPRIAHLNALVNVRRDIELLRANQALARERAELAAANAASVAALRHDEWVSGQKRIVREARMRKAIVSELGVVAEALTTSVGGWEGSRRRLATAPAATASATSAAAGNRRPAGDPRLSSLPYADCPLPVYDPLAGMTVLLDFVAGLPERAGRVQLAYAVYAGPMPVGAVACLPCGPGGAEADPYPEDERGQPRLSGGPTLTATFAGSKAIDGDGSSSVFLAVELQRVTPGGMRSLGWTALPLFRPCEGVSPDVDGDVPHSVFARAVRLPFFPPPLGPAALSLAALQVLDPIPDGPTLFLRLYTAGEMGAGGRARTDAFVPSLSARARYSNVLRGEPLGEQQVPGDAPAYLRLGPFEFSGKAAPEGRSSRRAAYGAEAPAAVPEEVEERGGREVLLRGMPPPALAAGSLWSSFLGLQLIDATFDLGLGYVPGKPLRLRARLVQPRAQALAGVTAEGVSQFFAAKEDRQLAARRRPAKATEAEEGGGSAFGEALDLCLSQLPSFLGGGRPGDAESAYIWTGAGVDLYSAGAVSEVPVLATLSPVPPYLCGRLGVELLASSRLLLEAFDPATGSVELSASVPLSDLLREVILEGARRAGPAPGIRALMTACISHTGLGQDRRLACTLPCSAVASLQKGTAISGAQSLRGRLPASTRTLQPPASAALSFRLLGSVAMLQRAAAALLEDQGPLDRPKPPLPVGVGKKEDDKPSRSPSRLPSIPSGAASVVVSDSSAPWLRVSQPGGLPANWPAPSPREFCSGINCIVLGARFLPDNVTVTRLTVSLIGADWGVVPDGSKSGVCHPSSPSLLCPDFDLSVAFEGGLPDSPALLLMLETVEAHTKAVQMVGYGLLPLGAGWAGAALLEGCFQLPLHQLPPSRVGPPSSFSLSSSPRLPCATVLLRVLRAAPSVPSPPLPAYSARAFDSTRAVPGPEELELYPRRAEVAAPSLHDYLAGHTLAGGTWERSTPPPASVSSPWPWAPTVIDEVRAWESELFEDGAPGAFDLGYLAPYEPPAGFRVKVSAIHLGDAGAPCLPLALHSILPTGHATAGSPAVTASRDYEASTRRVSRFTDAPRAHPAVEWAAEKALLVEVKTVLPPSPTSALSDPVTLEQVGWTVVPLFDAAGEGYVWRGRFVLPLLQGAVPQAVVDAIAGGETASSLWQQLLGIVRPTHAALAEYGEEAAEKVRASADVLGSGVAGVRASPTEAQRKKNGALIAAEAANVVASKRWGGDVSAAVGRMMSKRTIVAAPRAAWWPGAFPPLAEPHAVGQGKWAWALSTVEVVLQDAQLPTDALDAAPVRPHPCLPAAVLEHWSAGPPAASAAPLAGLIADGAVGSAAWSARCRGVESAIRRAASAST